MDNEYDDFDEPIEEISFGSPIKNQKKKDDGLFFVDNGIGEIQTKERKNNKKDDTDDI